MNMYKQDGINVLMGIWLIFSPWVLQYTDMVAETWNSYLVGVAVLVVATWALLKPAAWKELINLILGLWLISSPWLLQTHHHAAATKNIFIVGVVVIIVAAVSIARPRFSPPANA